MSIETDYESLGPLPDGWQSVPLKRIVTKLVDGSHNPPAKQESGHPMLSARNIENNNIVFDDFRYIADEDFDREHARTRIKPGDVLLTIVGTIGRSAIVPAGMDNFTLQRSVAVLTPSGVLPKYLMYQFQAPFVQRHFEKNARGTAQKGVYLKTLGQTPIRVAPLDQQKRIVAEIEKQFSRLDEAVANLKRVKANLKRYKAAVLKAAVEGRLVETEAETARREGRSYETGEQLLQRILETRRSQWKGKGKYKEPAVPDTTDLPDLPEGWIWSNFERAAERVTVGHVGSMKDEYVEQGVPFLRSQNVRANRYDPEGLKFVSNEFHRQLAKSTLRPGDIVVVRSGSVGVSCVIPEHLREANCSDLVIVKNPQAVLPNFGAFYMNSVVETRVAAGKVGVALTHFNTQSVAELPLPVPPMAEQHRIVAEVDRRLSLMRETETQVDANLQRAARLRQSLLARAFSGALTSNRCSQRRTSIPVKAEIQTRQERR